jgi:hypothetical protein
MSENLTISRERFMTMVQDGSVKLEDDRLIVDKRSGPSL